MDIEFRQLMPAPLASMQHGADSIWGANVLLQKGKKIMLNASSGKGKSTFTHTIFGLRRDYTGTLLYGNKDIRSLKTNDWTRIRQKQISVVFQDLQLFDKLSVRENLLIKNRLSDVFTEKELEQMLDQLEIAFKWNEPCGLLSMGQQQRVAIIRALCQPFEWLILDEPFSHLDTANSARCLKLINDRCDQQNAGFVLTTLGDDYAFSYDQELKL